MAELLGAQEGAGGAEEGSQGRRASRRPWKSSSIRRSHEGATELH